MGLLDLSKFQKVAEDKKITTLKHEDGHEIKIIHSALPKIKQEQLKRLKMADGGPIFRNEEIENKEKGVNKIAPQFISKGHISAGQSEAGAEVRKGNYKEAKRKAMDVHNQSTDMPNPNIKGLAHGGMAHYDQGTPDAPVSQYDANPPMANAAPNAPPGPILNPELTNVPAPVPINSIPNSSLLNSDQTLNAPAAVGLQQQAAREQQAVDTAKGAQVANTEDAYIKQKAALADRDQSNYNDLKNHTDDFSKYMMANPINPNAYLENMGTGKKISTAIGLALGGFKQGFSGGNNPAMDFLNNQINRDIEGQKARADQAKTIWGAYNSLYGDANIANNLAKVSMNDIYTHRMQMQAAQLATPQAKAVADNFAAQKAIENNQLLIDSAGRRGQLQVGGGGNNAPNINLGTNSNGAPPSGGFNFSGVFDPNANASESGPEQKEQPKEPDRILSPNAEKQYQWSISKYNTVQSPEEKAEISQEYLRAKQVDKSLNQIDQLYPQAVQKATWSGAVNDKIDPKTFGAIGAALGEVGSAAASPVTGGASLLAALPAAAVGAAGGAAAGGGAKLGLRAIGGQQETQYQTAIDSIRTAAANALASSGMTPSETSSIVDQFLPTKFDSEATWKDKLEKLKQKIISKVQTGALDTHNMTLKKR